MATIAEQNRLGMSLAPPGIIDYARFAIIGCYLLACAIFLLLSRRVQTEYPIRKLIPATIRAVFARSRPRSAFKK
jgi:hypothetical protein